MDNRPPHTTCPRDRHICDTSSPPHYTQDPMDGYVSNRSSPPPYLKNPTDRPRDSYMSVRASPPPYPKEVTDRPSSDRPSPPPYTKGGPSDERPTIPPCRCGSTDKSTQSHGPSGHLDVDTTAAKKIQELETAVKVLTKKVKNHQYLEIQLTRIELELLHLRTILKQS